MSFPYSRTALTGEKIFSAVIIAVIGLGAYLLIATYLLQIVDPKIHSMTQVLHFIGQELTTPAFKGSTALTFVSLGIVGPILETKFFFVRILEWLAFQMKVPVVLNFMSVGLQTIIIGISTAFTVFHWTVRLASDTGLLITFAFAYISCWLVIWKREEIQASILHIINNSFALAIQMGLLAIGGMALL